MATSTILEPLRNRHLFALIPGLFELGVERGRVELLPEGTSLVTEGDPIARLFIPLNSSLSLCKLNKETGYPLNFGFLQKNRALCLRQLLNEETAPYTAVVERETLVFSLPSTLVRELVNKHPEIKSYLSVVTSSSATRALKLFLEQHGAVTASLIKIISKVQLIEIKASQGDEIKIPEKTLLLLENGALQISYIVDGRVKDQALVKADEWIGGESLAPPHRISYKITASSDSIYRFLDFTDLLMLITELDLLSTLHSEPKIKKTRNPLYQIASSDLAPLPGILLPADALSKRYKVNPNQLSFCRNSSDSVAACLNNICQLLGLPVDEYFIRAEVDALSHRSMAQLATIIEPYGAHTSLYVRRPEDLTFTSVPALIHAHGRMLILLECKKNKAIVMDSVYGYYAIDLQQLTGFWDGRVLEVEKSPLDKHLAVRQKTTQEAQDSQKQKTKKTEKEPSLVYRVVRETLAPMKIFLPSFIAYTLIGMTLGITAPKIIGWTIDVAFATRDIPAAVSLCAAAIMVAIFQAIVMLSTARVGVKAGVAFEQRLTKLMLRQMFRSRPSTTSDSVGDGFARIGALHDVAHFMSKIPIGIALQVATIIGVCLALIPIDLTIFLVNCAAFPILLLIRHFYKDTLKSFHEKSFDAAKKLQSLTTEQISSIQAIKAASAENFMCRRWELTALDGAKLEQSILLSAMGIEGMLILTSLVTNTTTFVLGAIAALKGSMTIGEVMALNLYSAMLYGSFASLAATLASLEQFKVSSERVQEVFDQQREDETHGLLPTQSFEFSGKISLESICHRYGSEGSNVIDQLSMQIFPGQVVALVGASGCGKTTLANIIAGNVTPVSGRIYFDGIDSSMISIRCRRQQVGLISQESRLFAGSIRENIALGCDIIDGQQLTRASIDSGAQLFIDEIVSKEDYRLAEGGIGLSGGQAQRVGIARILYRNPKVVIFDEATSALDAETEAIILKNLKIFLKNRTAIVIAHRLSTIRAADRIVVLENGKIVGDGNHIDLLQHCSTYSELFASQVSAGVA